MTGRGAWAFPPRTDPSGRVATLSVDESLRQSLEIIVGTMTGERVMRPDFGIDLQAFGFEVINVATLDLIRTTVRDSLLACEPRVAEVEVDVSTDAQDGGLLQLLVRYRAHAGTDLLEMTQPLRVDG